MPTLTKFDENVNVRMTAETTERLRALARRREVSLGALVREAVRHWLADTEPEPRPRTRKRNGP